MMFQRAMLSTIAGSIVLFALQLTAPYPFADITPDAPCLWQGVFLSAAAAVQWWAVKPRSWHAAIVSCTLLVIACSSRMTALMLLTDSAAAAWLYVAIIALVATTWSALIRDFEVLTPPWVLRLADRVGPAFRHIPLIGRDLQERL